MYCSNLYKEIIGHYLKPKLFTDNAGVMRSSDRGFGKKTKHISVKELYVKELVELKELEIFHINTKKNVADVFTKGLDLQLLTKFRTKLHVVKEDEELIESDDESDRQFVN